MQYCWMLACCLVSFLMPSCVLVLRHGSFIYVSWLIMQRRTLRSRNSYWGSCPIRSHWLSCWWSRHLFWSSILSHWRSCHSLNWSFSCSCWRTSKLFRPSLLCVHFSDSLVIWCLLSAFILMWRHKAVFLNDGELFLFIPLKKGIMFLTQSLGLSVCVCVSVCLSPRLWQDGWT